MNRTVPPQGLSAAERTAYELRFSELLARLATTMIHRPDTTLDHLINDALCQIASFVGADRGYVFFYDVSAGLARYSYEWCAPGISAQLWLDPVVDNQTLGEWVERHQRGEAVVVDDVAALGDLPIRRVLERQEVVSTAMVPMQQDGTCVGFCGFDSVRSRRRYSDQELRLLQVFSQMLVNLQLHEETRAALERERHRLEIIVEGTSAGTWIWWLDSDRLQVNDR